MEFNKRYNRIEFVDFLQHKFLPEDFVVETTSIDIERIANMFDIRIKVEIV